MAKSEVEKCLKHLFPKDNAFLPMMEINDIPVTVKTGFIDSDVYRELKLKKKRELAGQSRIPSGVAMSEDREIVGIVVLPQDILDQTKKDSQKDFRWGVRDEIAMQLFCDSSGDNGVEGNEDVKILKERKMEEHE